MNLYCYYYGYGPNISTSKNKDLEIEKWWEKQEQLKIDIEKTCQKFNSSLQQSNIRKKLIYDRQHNILFCGNAKVRLESSEEHYLILTISKLMIKVGTTTWFRQILHLSFNEYAKKLILVNQHNYLHNLHNYVHNLFPVQDDDPDIK